MMIFEPLLESAKRGELILVDGGFCHWHLRRDGQITIREIIVLPTRRRQGIGAAMLEQLKRVEGASSIFAKCPHDLDANRWYYALGFTDEGTETTKSGRRIRLWRFRL
jgi:GNAT superfamily N-acetyltransferase